MEPIWKTIPNYPEYEASNTGEIRNKSTFRVLKQKIDKNGYLRINLYKNREQKSGLQVHRLIVETFLIIENNHFKVCHIDNNRRNNNINNLQIKYC